MNPAGCVQQYVESINLSVKFSDPGRVCRKFLFTFLSERYRELPSRPAVDKMHLQNIKGCKQLKSNQTWSHLQTPEAQLLCFFLALRRHVLDDSSGRRSEDDGEGLQRRRSGEELCTNTLPLVVANEEKQ